MQRWRAAARHGLLAIPVAFVAVLLVAPLALTFAVSFWERAGPKIRPAFTFASYAEFLDGARLVVFERSLLAAAETTALGLLIAYPIAYFLGRHARPAHTRIVLALFTVPFLVNYILRTFAWTYLLARTGPVNDALIAAGVVDKAVDWLLFSDFSVLIGLLTSYMPFMVYPLWLAIAGIDRRLIEASWVMGASPRATFWRVTLPLSMPGVFAAVIFGFVGSFGEGAVPTILGGVGYQLMGNTITSALDVLNYPLAAAMSSIVVAAMLMLMAFWYAAFDMRSFLGKILRWRV
jgi:ABC-type spermidine/putrescine transport system permease subunit I